ncbi:MAG TPA: hypothetical protein VHS52_04060 [Acidimicrobiales bacterium]|nr:hypothetical protein [Acidimicrobiales bacterium]
MDDGTAVGVKATRWLAWAGAGLLAAGVVFAATVATHETQADVRVVAAAGGATGAVDLPTTVATPATTAPPATTPPTTASFATTVAKPVVTTSPPVKAPAATAPPTTLPARSTTTPPTTTTQPNGARAAVTIVSQYAYDVDVTLNGRVFRVAAGATVGPIDLALAANGNDVVEVRVVSQPTCGEGDAGGYFTAGGHFRLSVIPANNCGAIQGPTLRSTPA